MSRRPELPNGRSLDRRSWRRVAFALTLVLGILACATERGGRDARTHGWMGERGIVVPHDSFPADCTLCHAGDDWNTLRDDFAFDHLAETGVALVGAHAEAQCLRCHNDRGPVSSFAVRGCAGCHQDVHQGTLGSRCTDCHDELDWNHVTPEVASHQRTRFPLVGVHLATPCFACHPGGEVGNWARVDVTCETCHADDAASAQDPDHVAQGWVTDCQRCHAPTGWEAGFVHSFFPLTGRHAATDCSSCHTGGDFGPLPTTCIGCHQADFDGADDPNHVDNAFPTSCELCHDTSTWEGAMFSHAGIQSGCVECHQADFDGTTDPDHRLNGFPVSCEQCHATAAWEPAGFDHVGTTSGCVQCHQLDYDGTDDPDHAATGIPTSCELCHSTRSWDRADFDHQGIRTGCVECHLVDYQETEDPDHVAQNFPTSCEQCHDTRSWEGGGFDHSGVRSGCVECHLEEYQETRAPNHAKSGFPTTCEQCHSTRAWPGADFDHTGVGSGCVQCHLVDYQQTSDPDHDMLGYPTSCEQCHGTRDWRGVNFGHRGIQSGCVQCHLVEYQQTSDPSHARAGYPTSCEQCHSTLGWPGANYDHAGVGRGCVQCHLLDYQQTNDPNHAAAGFPTSCELCHGTRGWEPADFNHAFPINNGDHAGLDCADCHTNPRNFQVFTCTDCHAHTQREMDDEHDRVGGYIYNSPACYACHPDGKDR